MAPKILFVCTANVCRSPLAAALMVKHGSDAGADILVSSASVDSTVRAIHPRIAQLISDYGAEVIRTQSVPLTPDLVGQADLVLTMTGAHAIEVGRRFPKAQRKTFTLTHFVEILTARPVPERPEDLFRSLRKEPRVYSVNDDDRDIDDPMGRDEETFVRVGAQLDQLIRQIASRFSQMTDA